MSTGHGRTPRGSQKVNALGAETFTQANGAWRGQQVLVRQDDVQSTSAWEVVDGQPTTRITLDAETGESVYVFGGVAEVRHKLGLAVGSGDA